MIDDLKHRLDFLASERVDAIGRAHGRIMADAAARGALHSSGRRLKMQDEARDQIEAALQEFFAAADHAESLGVPPEQQQPCVDAALDQVLQALRSSFGDTEAGGKGGAYGMTVGMLDEATERARSLLRQHRAGFIKRGPAPTYSMTVTASPGAAIQQGGHGNRQSVSNSFDLEAARAAATLLSRELAGAEGDGADDLRADLTALQAQLSRSEVRTGLVSELGKSLRAALEGATGGMLSAGGLVTAAHLWSALALS